MMMVVFLKDPLVGRILLSLQEKTKTEIIIISP